MITIILAGLAMLASLASVIVNIKAQKHHRENLRMLEEAKAELDRIEEMRK